MSQDVLSSALEPSEVLSDPQPDALTEALTFFVTAFTELAILFLVISILVAWINQKLPAARIQQLLQGPRGYGFAVLLGAVTPFCSCSTLPMTTGLIQARAPFGPVMTFLFTSPLLNPFLIGLFWLTLGGQVTLTYGFFVIGLAVLAGQILSRLHFERFIRDDLLGTCGTCSSSGQPANQSNWKTLTAQAWKQFKSFTPYMAIGVAIGALLHGYIPESLFQHLGQNLQFWLIPLCAVLGAFLYIRASTMIPIAASLLAKGLSLGAIMSLTIAGAGASLPEMIMMKRMFHWPLIFAFILLVFTTACLTGFAIDLL